MPQQIIDLDAAVPETLGVRCDGEIYEVPGDIPIPTFLTIERAVQDLEDPESEVPGAERMQALYDLILDLFRIHQPDLEELPIGPKQLGVLIVRLYGGAADEDGEAGKAPTAASGTTSTSRKRSKRSASSKS